MRIRSVLSTILAVSLTTMFAVPPAAVADAFVTTRTLTGTELDPPVYRQPDISGDHVVYGVWTDGGHQLLRGFDLPLASSTFNRADPTQDLVTPRISGNWVVWWTSNTQDIAAMKADGTGRIDVTNDGSAGHDSVPDVSTADGAYVVWSVATDGQIDVHAKNLGINGKVFTIAGGTGDQGQASIYGKRVAYTDDSSGKSTVFVKTIGSSAAPLKISADGATQYAPEIGSHLVAWLTGNTNGKLRIKYYDYDTGFVYDGPTSATSNLERLDISGDRIVYTMHNGSDYDVYVFDTRLAKTDFAFASLKVAGTSADETDPKIDGSKIVYSAGTVEGGSVMLAKLAVPSISLKSVPTRISHGGKIKLAGTISDQGISIGSASLGVEKYGSGKWTRIKTITATATGTFSTYTPKNYSKTKYRVVYDGKHSLFGSGLGNHLSSVSAVRTAWPY
jgi:hypothetical protein